ncbi:M10 family metallopeptidase C-terminal domain-containing protein [Arsenophonus sp.]|uniref:M10 family metallopeptidase C-terminal domain-containing protein n=1 Tax=Arsenophonus sp. TaxID=1872640 RepID=UPI0028633047|nr:M10 family metallopeptidase C-terminal domain-containing protein [Arsenophonus sp.]MDR5617124.1 M10 family metallopeptidase C-terminal domain-containing protein [Arsenophonus sp.]
MIESYLTKKASQYYHKVMAQLNSNKRGYEVTKNNKQSYDSYEASQQILNPTIANNNLRLQFENGEITYSFERYNDSDKFDELTHEQRKQVKKALDAWSDVVKIKFIEVGKNTTSAIRFFATSNIENGKFSYISKQDMNLDSIPCFFNIQIHSEILQPKKGNYGQMVLVHQIGHVVGLSHPGNYTNIVIDNESPHYLQWELKKSSYWKNTDYIEDSRQYTVMSNWSERYTNGDFGGFYPCSPLLDDITASQSLHGANMEARKGNTVYGFHSNTNIDYYSINNDDDKNITCTIWDAGGNDTLDFSAYYQDQQINLNPGSFSNVGGLKGNISIAKKVIIENAIGGRGNDIIIGNEFNNIINGGAGSDIIYGNLGQDILWGGDNINPITFSKNIAKIHSYVLFTPPYQESQQPEHIVRTNNHKELFSPSLENETLSSNIFVYTDFEESLPTSPDMIMDFRTNKDKIDLSAINANHNDANNGKNFIHFVLEFNGVPGETVISYNNRDHFHYISINADDDLKPDFVIKIAANIVTAHDFIL